MAHHIEGPAGIEVHRRGPLWWHIVQAVADTEGATAAERGAHRRTHATIGIGWRVPCLKHGGALAFAIEWLREGRGRMHGMGSLLGAPTRSVLGRLALHAAQRGPPERFLLQKPPPQRRLPLSPGPRRSTSAEMSSNTSRFNETSMPCRLLLGTSGGPVRGSSSQRRPWGGNGPDVRRGVLQTPDGIDLTGLGFGRSSRPPAPFDTQIRLRGVKRCLRVQLPSGGRRVPNSEQPPPDFGLIESYCPSEGWASSGVGAPIFLARSGPTVGAKSRPVTGVVSRG